MKYLSYGKQFIDQDDIKAVADALKGDWLTQGPKVAEFEQAIANYCGAKYAVAVNNGTAALEIAYRAAGLKKGDEVITTPLTFAATSNMLLRLGVKPVFVDIGDNPNIDSNEIVKKITTQTKAIVIVDFAGHPCDLDEIKEIAQKRGLLLIEDGAHSLGSEYKGKKIGALADLTIFSFHPVKLITTGEGGMVLTDNEKFYQKMLGLRHHSIVKNPEKGAWYYEIKDIGCNFRLTDFQCALGLSQLKKINQFIAKRREVVARYNQAFEDEELLIIPQEKDYAKTAWHIYSLQFNLSKLNLSKKELYDVLKEQSIAAQAHYIPLHLQPLYQKLGYKKYDFPKSEKYYEQAFSLPLFFKITDEQVADVIKVVKGVVSNNN